MGYGLDEEDYGGAQADYDFPHGEDRRRGHFEVEKKEIKTVDLKALVGLHTLTAIETGYSRDQNYISFVLDGKTYTAWENDNDGYRSCMDFLDVSRKKIKNAFPETAVLAVAGKESYGPWTDTFLWFFAVENGKLVMEVGTDYSEAYYPNFLAAFHPENLPVNEGKK
jgi:hypothetical protein